MIERIRIKTILKFFAWAVLLMLLVVIVITWSAAGKLLHPDRRALQDYQLDWIRHPASHGMQIHAGLCANGKIPCLFTEPDAQAGPKERGKELRKQLAIMHAALSGYGETQGILVLLHGRSGRKEDLLPIAERFAAAGFKCVIPDLPAHGDNLYDSAHFATAPIERDIAETALVDARMFFGDMQSPAGVWGISMGGAFAVRAASSSPDTWKAVVIVSSFDSLDGVVIDTLALLPKPIPLILDISLGWMTRLRGGLALSEVHPDDWAKQVTAPVLVAHGDHDQVITLERGKHLFESLHSKKKSWFVVRGANHRNVLVTSTQLYARMGKWFIDYVR